MEELVNRLLKRYAGLESDRLSKISKLQEVAEFLLPDRASFYSSLSNSENREKVFDSTPEDSLQTLAAGLHSYLCSAMQAWFSLDLVMGEEYSTDDINAWIDEVQKTMLAKFNSDTAGFHSAAHEFFTDLPALGTACFFADEVEGQIRFQCIPLNEIRFSENHRGIIDTIFRQFEMTAAQIEEKWKGKGSDAVRTALDSNNKDKKFKILHAIEPRREYKDGSIIPKDMPFASCYIELDSKAVLRESGYMEMPMMVARWSKNSGEVHGRGIGQRALPDIRVLNEMQRTAMIAAEKQGDPVTLLPHQGFIGEFQGNGGDLNYYAGQGNIRDKVMTLGSDADLNAILAMISQKQDAIRKMFLTDKLQKLDGPSMTATEVIAIQNEKMRVLGPVLGRLQGEFLAPLINRVFKIMLRSGELPVAPEELQDVDVRIQYVSPISRAQKQVEAEAFGNAINYLSPVIQMSPSILENFDFDAIARDTQDLFGFPNKYLRTPDDVAKSRQAQAEAQAQQAEVAQAAQAMQLTGAAKELEE